MFCSICGSDAKDANFCPVCGSAVNVSQPAPPPQTTYVTNNYAPVAPPYGTVPVSDKEKWVAFILCFFLGYLGVHRFYVGKIGTGVFYLLTGGFFGIGWFVDWIVILCGSFKDSYGRPLL